MENIFSIDTDPDGTTTIVTRSQVRLVLTPQASAELADHLLNALPVTVTLAPHGRYTTTVQAPILKNGVTEAKGPYGSTRYMLDGKYIAKSEAFEAVR